MVTNGTAAESRPSGSGLSARLPWLLRSVNQRYRKVIRDRLVDRGLGELPQPGFWAVMVLARGGTEASRLAVELGVSKQAVSKLVNTLVEGGFVERRPNDADRRRTDLLLTGRGLDAAGVIEAAVRETNADFEATIGASRFAAVVQELEQLARRRDSD